ncbi:TetR/AcrR family transcriptional regulator [Bacillus sp. AFS017336]|uniref:TetR/AcrR family transcriptional regulator n=1 Tax=Bacillus sp. AFS017336 TaxID=2033489 RepID=UPI000BF1C9BF|nr:TetR/AcrR family transcriptional regulator [Bacillus sp. AFS017336]PEL13344.1 TetR family transcriptional regulator [Bacillus sp. AFS017336]
MQNEKSNNPISIRSRQWIIQSLLKLMDEKPFQKIAIKEITDDAGLVRKTFYRNFQSKEEVLYEHISELMQEAEKKFESLESLLPYTMTLIYFEFWKEHVPFLNLLHKNDLFIILLKQLQEYAPTIFVKFKTDTMRNFDETFLKYYTEFHSAGIWHMLGKWVESGTKETPEQLARIYADISLNKPHLKK